MRRVLDVAVSWEGDQPLTSAYHHKIAYYCDAPVLDAIKNMFAGKEIKVEAIVLGARGI